MESSLPLTTWSKSSRICKCRQRVRYSVNPISALFATISEFLTSQEKDAALDRWQEADQEIDRLQRELQNEKDSHQWRVVEQQAHQMQLEYYETVTVLNKEIEALQNDLRSTRDQLDMANTEVRELKRSNKDIEQQLIWTYSSFLKKF